MDVARSDRRLGARPAVLLALAVLALAFWGLAAINSSTGLRLVTASRYQLVGAIFLLLIAAVLAGRLRLSNTALWIVFAIAVISAGADLGKLHNVWVDFRDYSQSERGALAALELEGDRVAPDFQVNSGDTGVPLAEVIDDGPYLSAVSAFGSPAYTLDEIPATPGRARDLVRPHRVARHRGPAPPPGASAGHSCSHRFAWRAGGDG